MAKHVKSHKKKTIVIVGAALAGPTAAARAREINEHAKIILLERNTRVSYAMTGLALHLSNEVAELDDLNRERTEFFRDVYNIEVRTETEVVEIKTKKKNLKLTQRGIISDLKYDTLIFAAGAASVKPAHCPVATNFAYFRTLDDLASIKNALASGKKNFVVLGGGSMGAEALDGLVRGGAKVTLIEKKLQFLPEYSAEIARVAATSGTGGTKIITGYKQLDFVEEAGFIRALVIDGSRIETDFVVSAIGVTPRTELLKKAGVKLAANGSILIDDRCRTSVKDIFACSICVATPDGKNHSWVPQAAVSDKTAQVAGTNAAGGSAKLSTITGSQIIRLPQVEIGRVGPTEEVARKLYGKKNVHHVFVHARDKEAYMPGSSQLSIALFYHAKKGSLIALEAAGHGVKPRLDAFSAALAGGLNLDDLAMLDLAYTPAVGTARDALNVAATVASQRLQGITDIVTNEVIRSERKKYFVLDVSLTATHSGFHDAHIPLEKLRGEIDSLKEKFKTSKAKRIATLSETGRRSHLALRILEANGLKAVNISGGKSQT